jgi:predicted ester cyclase
MPKTTPEQNKAIVLEAFDTLFNKRDYAAAERFWSPKYIQHSAHIAPGREGLFALVRSTPDTLRYENQLIVAEGDYVIAHGRFTGNGKARGLDCGRRCPIRRRSPGRALGCIARRSHTGRIRQRPSHVWVVRL